MFQAGNYGIIVDLCVNNVVVSCQPENVIVMER